MGRWATAGLVVALLTTACSSHARKVEEADTAARSWAATAKAVTEQWAQSKVSLRFTRTTLRTAARNLGQQAASIRAIDPASATRIDGLQDALIPVLEAVARNQPDQARDLARRLPAMAPAPR